MPEQNNRGLHSEKQQWKLQLDSLLDGIFFSVCIAKHSSMKDPLFCMMYNSYPLTSFEVTDDQWDGNPVHSACLGIQYLLMTMLQT